MPFNIDKNTLYPRENMFPEGAVIKSFVIQHKQNKPQWLKQNKFIIRMRVEIQT